MASEGDEEGDGLANLLEYVTGRNPLLFDTGGPIPVVDPEPGSDLIRFVVARPGGHDAIVELETSTTLQNRGPGGWQVIAERIGDGEWSASVPITVTPGATGRERVLVTNPTTDPLRFYRLRARLVP